MQSITVSLVPVLPTLASVATFLVQAFTEGELAPEQVDLRGDGVQHFVCISSLRMLMQHAGASNLTGPFPSGLHGAGALQRASFLARSSPHGQLSSCNGYGVHERIVTRETLFHLTSSAQHAASCRVSNLPQRLE